MSTDRLRLCACGEPVYQSETMCLDCLVKWDASIVREEMHDRLTVRDYMTTSAADDPQNRIPCGHPIAALAMDSHDNPFCQMCRQGMA